MTAASRSRRSRARPPSTFPLSRPSRCSPSRFTAWWPHQYHIGQSDVAEVILESHEGGRWYERGVDGTECDWGRVLSWEPPSRVLFTWQINGHWQFDPDPTHASEIEVLFVEDGPGQTTGRGRAPPLRSARSAVRPSTTRSAAAAAGPLLLEGYAKTVANAQ